MNTEEYIEKYQSISKQIESLGKQMQSLKEQRHKVAEVYYDEHAPKYDKGSILRVYFEDGSKITGLVDSKFYFNFDTGEFRPNLFRVTKEGLKGKNLDYDLDKKIVKIKQIGKGATCENCAFKRLYGNKVFCSLMYKTGIDGKNHPGKITLDKLACSELSFVVWTNHIPYHYEYKMNGEHVKTKGYWLCSDEYYVDDKGHVLEKPFNPENLLHIPSNS